MKKIRYFQVVPEGIGNPCKQVDFFSVYRWWNIRPTHKKGPVGTGKQHPEIPWREMPGMRDIIIHQYFGVSLSMVWKVAKLDLPQVKDNLIKIDRQK